MTTTPRKKTSSKPTKGRKSPSRKRVRRYRREDWLELALNNLADEGPKGVQVHRLCETSGKTLGSLYHHFSDHASLLRELANYWRERNTHQVIEKTEASPDTKRVRTLHELSTALDSRVEIGMRRLADRHPEVEKVTAQVDQERINYLARLNQQRGLEPSRAKRLAELEYAAFVGAQILWPELEGPASAEYLDLLEELRGHLRAGDGV